MSGRLLVCGLGNPATQYKYHRHSIGFLILDMLRTRFHYPPWSRDRESYGHFSITSAPCVLFKSSVFMNKSGKAVAKAYKNLGGVDWGRLLVIHDDLELPVGKVKLRTMGMGRGHNGIRSCIETLRTEDFLRIAVGIGRPETRDSDVIQKYVLSDIPSHDLDMIFQQSFPAVLAELSSVVNLNVQHYSLQPKSSILQLQPSRL